MRGHNGERLEVGDYVNQSIYSQVDIGASWGLALYHDWRNRCYYVVGVGIVWFVSDDRAHALAEYELLAQEEPTLY